MSTTRSLEEQRFEFSRRRFLAMPLAGAIAWIAVAVAGLTLSPGKAALALFAATGTIVYLGIFLSRFTGEHSLDKARPKNAFDLSSPTNHTAVRWTVDSGLQTVDCGPQIGIFHAAARTVLIVAAWYLFPAHRFVVIPVVIVCVYALTIVVLERRWRRGDA